MDSPRAPRGPRKRRHRLAVAGALGALGIEAAAVMRQGYRPADDVIVQCRQGHRFSTWWVPGASIKALRLGFVRLQRCPVGRHWSIVKPVRAAALSEAERDAARAVHDRRLP